MKVLVAQSCPTLCNPIDCSPPVSSVHWIFQARILEWVALSYSRQSSQLIGWTWVSCITGRFFIIWATREAQNGDNSWTNRIIFSCLINCFVNFCVPFGPDFILMRWELHWCLCLTISGILRTISKACDSVSHWFWRLNLIIQLFLLSHFLA